MYFGTVRKVDPITGIGEVKTALTSRAIRFQRSSLAWDPDIELIIGQRLP